MGKHNQSLGITPLTPVYVTVLWGGVGYILLGFGRGHLDTQVATETSFLSVPGLSLVLYLSLLLCSLSEHVRLRDAILDPVCTDPAPRQPHSGVLKHPWGSVHDVRHRFHPPELTAFSVFITFFPYPQIFF